MENIIPYILISFVYVLSGPIPMVAINLFRVAAGARIFHTFVYAVVVVPQPARAIAFVIPALIIFYMAIMSAIFFVN